MAACKVGECLKCRTVFDSLMISFCFEGRRSADLRHIICRNCFNNQNKGENSADKLICPCCKGIFCDIAQSLEQAILLGEGAYYTFESIHKSTTRKNSDVVFSIHKKAITKLESVYLLNSTSIITAYLIRAYSNLQQFSSQLKVKGDIKRALSFDDRVYLKLCSQKLHDCCLSQLEQ